MKIEKYEQEIDNLKSQVFSITEKSKSLEYLKTENDSLRFLISKGESLRTELERQNSDLNNLFKNKFESNFKEFENCLKEKKKIEENFLTTVNEKENLKIEVGRSQIKIKGLEEISNVNKVNLEIVENYKEIQSLIRDNIKNENFKIKMQEQFDYRLRELQVLTNEIKSENSRLINENCNLNSRIVEFDQLIQKKNNEILDKKNKIFNLESALVIYKSEKYNFDELVKHREEIINKFNRVMEINYNLNEDVLNLNKSFNGNISDLNERIIKLENENERLNKIISEKSQEIIISTSKNGENILELEKLNYLISDLKTKIEFSQTVEKNNKILQEAIQQIFEYNKKITIEINELADYMIMTADKNMTAQNYIRQFISKLNQKDNEISEYKKTIEDYKSLKIQNSKITYKPFRVYYNFNSI
jgi:hypothetical protein